MAHYSAPIRRLGVLLSLSALSATAQTTTSPVAGPGDAATQLLSHPPNAQAQFLSNNSGWQASSTGWVRHTRARRAGIRHASSNRHHLHRSIPICHSLINTPRSGC
jgi:hypothetical protein